MLFRSVSQSRYSQGGIAVGSLSLRLYGAGVSSLGALRNISGNNSWSGTITALSASRIHSDAGVLTLSGANAISATNMGVTFGGSGDVVVSGTITTGTGSLTKEGSGTLTLSGTNTYTGATTITSGTLVLGASQVIANTSNVVMNGGTLNTNGFTETVGQLLLQDNSTLALGSGAHVLTFSSAGTFSFKRLTITGWQGSYGGAGSPGTAGRIFIGSGLVVMFFYGVAASFFHQSRCDSLFKLLMAGLMFYATVLSIYLDGFGTAIYFFIKVYFLCFVIEKLFTRRTMMFSHRSFRQVSQ